MSLLSTAEFERILHPVFEEDELTLILSGAVLGALSGLCQIWANKWSERREKEKEKGKDRGKEVNSINEKLS